MSKRWTEMWSMGDGPERAYCGIARTVEGYAVDVFSGDCCVGSEIYPTKECAEAAAAEIGQRYGRARRAAGLARGRDPVPIAV